MKNNSILSILLIFAFSISAYAQQFTGSVTDENGLPLPGASVIVQGTSTGVVTDFDGNFSIETSVGQTLNISFVGYATESVTLDTTETISIQLQPNALLDEVVVTALGISREKKSLGYAVSEVSGDNVNTIKDSNLASSLAGKVAGLQITQSGTIGSGSRVTIRGNNSLGGNTQALIVVDGIPIDGSGINSGSNDDGGTPSYEPEISGGGISDINPDDVESISVLKGPNAAALYGARAGNGVILITTKKGSRSQGLGISIKSNLYVDSPMSETLPSYQNEYGQGTLGASYTSPRYNDDRSTLNSWGRQSWGPKMNGALLPYYNDEIRSYSAQPDNVRNFFRNAFRAINSISLNQGFENGSIRFSYTNNSSESMLPNSDLQSHNFNLRAVANLSDKITIDSKATYFTQEINNNNQVTGAQGLLPNVYRMPRNVNQNDLKNYQVDNPSTPFEYQSISYASGQWGNPYWILFNDEQSERRNRFLGFTKIDFQLTNWLSAFARVGADITNIDFSKVYKPGHHFFSGGRMDVRNTNYGELNSDFLITAKENISDKLSFVLNAGGSMSKRTAESWRVEGSDFKIPTKYFINNLNNILPTTVVPQSIKKVNSLYGSLNLAYDNFLYVDVSARNDWSSTLSDENRSYLYNSASLSLILNQFIDPSQEIFNLIKLRGSIAEVGNDTEPYQLYQTFNLPGQGYLGLTTVGSPSTKLNSDLKPETVTSTEFGLELSMLDNKLGLDISVYDITTTDLIFNLPVPAATGYRFSKTNIGEVQNKGLEININGTIIDSGNLSWNSNLLYSKNENKINELADGLDGFQFNGSTQGGVSIRANVGGSIGDIYARTDTGTVSVDGIPVASAQPDELIGNAQPDALVGWSNQLRYKDFSLNFLIDARVGGYVFSQTSAGLDRDGVSKRSLQYRESGILVDGTVADTNDMNTKSITAQEYWQAMADVSANYVYGQDNVRLRELSIGYQLPSMPKFGIESGTIQLVGRNLFFFSKDAQDIDPESMLGTTLGIQGISENGMPTTKSVGLNLSLNF